MKFQHHGAVNGVTGSCHQLHLTPQNSLLVDCGLFQDAEAEGDNIEQQLAINFDISSIKALLITHSHIDHVGRIPYLLAAGFKGPIVATEATAALLPLVLEDALKVGVTRNQTLIDTCIRLLKKQLIALPYRRWHAIDAIAGCRVKFQPAGHILGSAYIEIDYRDPQATTNNHAQSPAQNKSQRIIFSGDLGAPYAPLLPAPKSPYRADILVIESTYGDKLHAHRRERATVLATLLEQAVRDNGIVLIPAFSMGRTQELLYEIEQIQHRASNNELIKQLESIVDSPLAAKFTEKYRQFKPLWDAEAKKRLASDRHPLDFDNLTTLDSHQQHIACIQYLAKRKKPAVVIAAGGMCNGGRIVNYLKQFISKPTTDILLVGYQAKGTTGREIQTYGPKGGYTKIDGQKYDINAKVHTLSSYSAHADQANLLNFIKRMRKRPKQVRIVHGDDEAKQALKAKITDLFPDIDVLIPEE
ncbi:MBL fold metallo-hydrolase [Corallincola luteus]|uniref:MBL fold metallo-hydrolase n=1 Tax=Corallincola luteus TaxID=1775177 RepID=A0ABY2ARW2_9GAMM|nr:MBL fold metallo-hydrolase [Corallincola luteus]TCI05438.1 MBL fold metallo-hydrolase [Corallincola luteus]